MTSDELMEIKQEIENMRCITESPVFMTRNELKKNLRKVVAAAELLLRAQEENLKKSEEKQCMTQ